MSAPAVTDEIAGAREPTPGSRWRAGVAVALVALALGLLALERYESQRQLDDLLAAAADTEQVVGDARRSLGGLVNYSNGLLARTDLEPEQRAAVLDSFAVDAGRFPPRMEQPRAAVEQVRPLPWDDELAGARQAYLDRVDAWTAFVASAVDAPDTLLLERRATREVREQAAAALLEAADGRSAAAVTEIREALLSR